MWIDADKQLPENDDPVLLFATINGENVYVIARPVFLYNPTEFEVVEYGCVEYMEYRGDAMIDKAICWMPLPEVPDYAKGK